MSHAACPACGGAQRPGVRVVAEMMFGLDERIDYAECADCGSLWLLDVPEDLGRFYPEDYYSVDLDPERVLGRPGVRQFATATTRSVLFGKRRFASAAGAVVRRRQFHSFLLVMDSIALAGLPKGRATRVLDVGCGSGILIYALGLAGVEVVIGVDPFAPGDRTFDSGARVLKQDLGDVEGSFDLVMFHHSFEHVPDPAESLAQACRLLSPGGRILVRMPTVSSDAFATYGTDWVQLDAPRHLTLFSRESVQMLAERQGLQVAAVVDDSTAFQFWGSEQVRRGIPLMDQRSQMVSPGRSEFSSAELAAWDAQAAELNARSRGDQATWLLVRA